MMATQLWDSCQNLFCHETNVYSPIEPDEIRVLNISPGSGPSPIECTLQTAKIDPTLQYEALSWTWGPACRKSKSIVLNGSRFPVRPSLHDALWALRSPGEPRKLWVDSLCINQLNIKEKEIQLPLMGKIYKSAQAVVIWLGTEADDSEYLMDCVRSQQDDEYKTYRFFEAWKCFIHRPWFTRTWIVQEHALNQNTPQIACGAGATITLDYFFEVNNLMSRVNAANPVVQVNDKEDLQKITATIKHGLQTFHTLSSHERTRRLVQESTGLELREALRSVGQLECTNPKDRVYGILGLLRPETLDAFLDHHQVDYGKSKEEIYHATAAYLFEEGVDEDLFNYFKSMSCTRPDYPSWAFSLDTLHTNTLPLWITKKHSMKADTVSTDKKSIFVRGIVLDQVEAIVSFESLPPTSTSSTRLELRMYPYLVMNSIFFLFARLFIGIYMPFLMLRMITQTSFHFRDFTSLLYQLDHLTNGSQLRAEAGEPLWRVLDTAERIPIPPDGPLEPDVWYHKLVAAGSNPSLFNGLGDKGLITNDLRTTLQSSLGGRNCFVGVDGWYGVVQGSPCRGDVLALLFPDHFMPFILRPEGDRYKLVGIAHVSPSLRERVLREFSGELKMIEII